MQLVDRLLTPDLILVLAVGLSGGFIRVILDPQKHTTDLTRTLPLALYWTLTVIIITSILLSTNREAEKYIVYIVATIFIGSIWADEMLTSVHKIVNRQLNERFNKSDSSVTTKTDSSVTANNNSSDDVDHQKGKDDNE